VEVNNCFEAEANAFAAVICVFNSRSSLRSLDTMSPDTLIFSQNNYFYRRHADHLCRRLHLLSLALGRTFGKNMASVFRRFVFKDLPRSRHLLWNNLEGSRAMDVE
jgi:hypothetical protein